MKELRSGKCPMAHHKGEVKDGSALIDALPFPVILLNASGQIQSINENVSYILGYTSDVLRGKDYFKTFHQKEEVAVVLHKAADALNRPVDSFKEEDFWRWISGVGEVYEAEWTYVSRVGRHISACGRFAPMPESGNIIISFFDISSYKKLITELSDSESKTRMVFETAVDGFITIDEFGIIQSFNKAAERLFGYLESEVIGQNVKILMPRDISIQHDGYLKNYKKSGNAQIIGKGREVYGMRKDGSQFPMHLSVGEGEVSGGAKLYTGIIRDLTEYKAAEEIIRKTNTELDQQNKIKTDIDTVVEATRGSDSLSTLATGAIAKLAEVTSSAYGAIYLREGALDHSKTTLKLMGTFAYTKRKNISTEVKSGEGILGQVVLEKKTIILTNVPRV